MYIIIDWSQDTDSPEFMHVLIKPLDFETTEEEDEEINDYKLFSMDNDNVINPIYELTSILKMNENGLKNIFHFDFEKHYEINEMKKLMKKIL